jgi:hypothetical protein
MRAYVISISIFFHFSLYVNYNQNNKIVDLENQLKEKTSLYYNAMDSLDNMMFDTETIVGRYEMALDYFKEQDSCCANKFEKILNTETE